MDTGVAGRIGRIAVKHVMMASEQDSESVTTHLPLMVEDIAEGVEMKRARVFKGDVILVSLN